MVKAYCPNKRCRMPLRLKVNLFFDVPATYFRAVKKESIRKADFRLEGAGWNNFIAYCPSCGKTFYPGVLPFDARA